MRLHHFAYNIKKGSLEKVKSCFEVLGLKVSYIPELDYWCMFEEKGRGFDIQIIETENNNISSVEKIKLHIAFISDNPLLEIEKIEKWSIENKINFKKGGWNKKEHWFDLPDIFNNFVIEIIHTSVVE